MVTVQHPRDLLAERIVLQPYGFWHRPATRLGAMAIGLMLGVFAAGWLFVASGNGSAASRAESEALKGQLEAAQRELDAARLSAVGLAREVEKLAREVQRLRDEAATTQQKAQKRRERRENGAENEGPRPQQAAAADAPSVEAPATPPRAE
jgi:hypothetical protein